MKEIIIDGIKGVIESEFLSGAFLLSLFAGIALILKSVGKKIYDRIKRRIVYSVNIEQTDELFLYLERWLKVNYEKQYRNVIAYLGEIYIPNYYNPKEEAKGEESTPKKEIIKYRQENDTIFIIYKGSYLKIYKGREKLENANSLTSLFFDHFNISILLYKSKIHQLLNEIIEYNQQFKIRENKREIFTWDGSYNWDRLTAVKMKNIDQVILRDEIKISLINDIDMFLKNEKWYTSKSIAYKRGYLFYGTPGNGKTSLAVAMADYTNRSIYSVTVSEIQNDSAMRSVFSRVGLNSVLLFEDVDTMFDKRKSSKGKLSFSTFLNCLDGVFYKHGLIIVMTTNHVDKLDPALIRDGRVDFRAEIKNPEFNEVKNYLELFYEQSLDIHKNGYDSKFPMSEIQNICLGNDIDKSRKLIFQP